MPLARRLGLGGRISGGAAGGGGRGLTLGPTPNVFGQRAGGPDGTVSTASHRRDSETLRDAQFKTGAAQSIKWQTGNRVTGSDYFSLESVDVYPVRPWRTGAAWIVPIGTTITVGTNRTYTIVRDSSDISLYNDGKLRVRAYTYDRPNTTGVTIKEPQVLGDAVTMVAPTGDWAAAYIGDTTLNIRLFYDTAGVEAVTHQVWQNRRWVDNLTVTGLAGKQGLPGAPGKDGADGVGASFAGAVAGNLVTVDASKQAADTGIDAADVVVDTDLATVAKTGAYSDLVGAPTVLTSAQIQALVGAMFTGNTETGLTATYNPGTQKIDVIVATGTPVYSAPAFSNVAVAGLAARHQSDFNIAGSYTLAWDLANHANISGTLAISQITTVNGSTTTSVRRSGIAAAASGTTTFAAVAAALDAVGENVEFRISGTDKQGAAIKGSYTTSRVAKAVSDTLWWGRLSTAAAFSTISTLSTLTLPGGGSKVVASNSDVAGDYRFPLGQPNGWIGWFVPTSVGTFKDVYQNNFKVTNTITDLGTRTVGGIEYRVYRHTREQKGDSNIDFEFRV